MVDIFILVALAHLIAQAAWVFACTLFNAFKLGVIGAGSIGFIGWFIFATCAAVSLSTDLVIIGIVAISIHGILLKSNFNP